MCGIAGFVGWHGDDRKGLDAARAMSAAVACRGPDDEGVWSDGDAHLAHRRLTVVDPDGGRQPMRCACGGREHVIVYNGELYNTDALRARLAGLGHRFRGHSDTEVLLAAYAHWGAACLELLEGIFAFAVFTLPDRRLFLARDRLGVKPLFYAEGTDRVVFGSELKALVAHPDVPARVGAEGMAEVFLMAPARTPGVGVFRGVAELLPGTFRSWGPEGARRGTYWRLTSAPIDETPERAADTVRELLEGAVIRQLVADVPVCAFLSGGLDSSAVTAFAHGAMIAAGKGPLTTFSVDFAHMERDFSPTPFQADLDGPWADRVSRHLGTAHHAVILDTPELVEALLDSLLARDLPGMADIDTSLLLLCREVKKHATVALSGEAADEVFGGYPWLFREDALAADTFPWARRLLDRASVFSPALSDLTDPQGYVARRYREALEEVPAVPGEDARARRLREVAYLNLSRFLPTLLDRKDRMSMAAGLEVRVPFCDHRLVEYVWNLPWSVKAEGGVAKAVLRRALSGVLPEDVLRRRKRPYPSTFNPAYGIACRDWILALLDDPGSPLAPWVDVAAVRRLADTDGLAADLPWFGQMMGTAQFFAYLVQVDTWFRAYNVEVV